MLNNLLCQNFKRNIDNIIQNSQIPPVMAYYILKDRLNELQKICNEVLQEEMDKFQSQQEKQKEKNDKEEEEAE